MPTTAQVDKDPHAFPSRKFLLLFVPLSISVTLSPFLLFSSMRLVNFFLIDVLAFITNFSVAIGGGWMVYQAIRYEERVARYVLLAFIPFMFIWYRLDRFPHRPKLVRVPADFN